MIKAIVFNVGIAFAVSVCFSEEKNSNVSDAKTLPLPYTVAKEWEIGNRKIIIIDKTNRNQKDMLRLGDQLKLENDSQENCHIVIFDDKQAADMKVNDSAIKQPAKTKDSKFYHQHLIGVYRKDGKTGHHEYWFGITDKGHQGKTTTVDYAKEKVANQK